MEAKWRMNSVVEEISKHEQKKLQLGKIKDNTEFLFDNATGHPLKVRDIMTPQAKKIRKGLFDAGPL